jgi:hypothetical protein
VNETATAEYFAEVDRGTRQLSAAVSTIKGRRDNVASQARAVDLSLSGNIAILATLWETANAFNQVLELVTPSVQIFKELDAFRAGAMHHQAEDPMTQRVVFLEKVIAEAAVESDLGLSPEDSTETVIACFLDEVRRRRNLSNAIKGAANLIGIDEVKSVEEVVRTLHEQVQATRARAEKEHGALETIAGTLGLNVPLGAAPEAFVEAVRRRVHQTVDALPPIREGEPFRRGEIIAGTWDGAPTDTGRQYVGKFVGPAHGGALKIERPFHQDDTDEDSWRIVLTDLNVVGARLATTEEVAEYGKLMVEGDLW